MNLTRFARDTTANAKGSVMAGTWNKRGFLTCVAVSGLLIVSGCRSTTGSSTVSQASPAPTAVQKREATKSDVIQTKAVTMSEDSGVVPAVYTSSLYGTPVCGH
jgi:hypothetical protein